MAKQAHQLAARSRCSQTKQVQPSLQQIRDAIDDEMHCNEFKMSHNEQDYKSVGLLGTGTYGNVFLVEYDPCHDRNYTQKMGLQSNEKSCIDSKHSKPTKQTNKNVSVATEAKHRHHRKTKPKLTPVNNNHKDLKSRHQMQNKRVIDAKSRKCAININDDKDKERYALKKVKYFYNI